MRATLWQRLSSLAAQIAKKKKKTRHPHISESLALQTACTCLRPRTQGLRDSGTQGLRDSGTQGLRNSTQDGTSLSQGVALELGIPRWRDPLTPEAPTRRRSPQGTGGGATSSRTQTAGGLMSEVGWQPCCGSKIEPWHMENTFGPWHLNLGPHPVPSRVYEKA